MEILPSTTQTDKFSREMPVKEAVLIKVYSKIFYLRFVCGIMNKNYDLIRQMWIFTMLLIAPKAAVNTWKKRGGACCYGQVQISIGI